MVKTCFRRRALVGVVTWFLAPCLLAQDPGVVSAKATLRHSGQVLSVKKTIDLATGETSFVATDAAGSTVDYRAALQAERAAAAAPSAKLVEPLQRFLGDAGGQPIVVGIWL